MNSNAFHNPRSRTRIGKLSGAVGIICNALLSAVKIAAGYLSGSMSIMADGLNNLSDAASSIVMLLGFRFAEKPADKEHPYGHARYEYLAGLTVSALILVIGYELCKSSVQEIFRPSPVGYSPVLVSVLIFSILLKSGMMLFNLRLGRKIDSKALLAAAADSRNDAIATCAVLAAILVERFTGSRIDGYMGLLVSLFILYSGIAMARETVSPLLGEGADSESRRQLTEYIESCPMVIGCHDLMVHDYGPGRRYASIHVEMAENVDAMQSHETIDRIERECLSRFDIHLVIHYDPVPVDDPETERLKQLVSTILKVRDERLEIHDFRMQAGVEPAELIFDMIVPEDLLDQKQQILSALEQALDHLEKRRYALNVTFDL